MLGQNEHLKAIIAIHHDDFLDIKFPKCYDHLPNDIGNTNNSKATFKDLGSFNISVTIGNQKEVIAMLDLYTSINLMSY